jgi:hypothetical protein
MSKESRKSKFPPELHEFFEISTAQQIAEHLECVAEQLSAARTALRRLLTPREDRDEAAIQKFFEAAQAEHERRQDERAAMRSRRKQK